MQERETIFGLQATQLKFGPGASQELGWELERLQARKILLVIDPVHRSTGVFDHIAKQIDLANRTYIVFDAIAIEPTLSSFKAMGDFAVSHDFDAIVTVGGGSTIDTAKVANLMKVCGGEVMDYVNRPIGRGKKPDRKLLPLIAIPTTAGTGSEATTVSVLDIPELKVKSGISHQYLRPDLAIVDPELLKTAPAGVIASSGLDVICHAIESYISRPFDQREKPKTPGERPPYQGSNPISDLWSLKAIELGGQYFLRAVHDHNDLEARGYMMLGATLAGIGFGTAGVHIPHACSYPIAGLKHEYQAAGYPSRFVPHGFSVIVTSPASFRYTYDAAPEKHIKAAELLKGQKVEQPGPHSLPNELLRIMKGAGTPSGLKELGYAETDIPQLVEGAIKQQRLLVGSPKAINEDRLAEIFRQSMENW